MLSALQFSQPQILSGWMSQRPGETRLGAKLDYFTDSSSLAEYRDSGGVFVLLGIPEDIGPRANMGLGGADLAWSAFAKQLVNLQYHTNMPKLAVAGTVKCDDLMEQAAELDNQQPQQLAQLRSLCAQLDERVQQVVQQLVEHQLIPIVIGGGHNNAFPIIAGASGALGSPLNCINLDPHSDFRLREGRHSGNGFSEAHAKHLLKHYFVMGMDPYKNSAENLAQFEAAGGQYISNREVMIAENQAVQLFHQADMVLALDDLPIGVEIDLDAISGVPASAYNTTGVSHQFALSYIDYFAKSKGLTYLHLAEGAPSRSPLGLELGKLHIGQLLCQMVLTFITAANQSVDRV